MVLLVCVGGVACGGFFCVANPGQCKRAHRRCFPCSAALQSLSWPPSSLCWATYVSSVNLCRSVLPCGSGHRLACCIVALTRCVDSSTTASPSISASSLNVAFFGFLWLSTAPMQLTLLPCTVGTYLHALLTCTCVWASGQNAGRTGLAFLVCWPGALLLRQPSHALTHPTHAHLALPAMLLCACCSCFLHCSCLLRCLSRTAEEEQKQHSRGCMCVLPALSRRRARLHCFEGWCAEWSC